MIDINNISKKVLSSEFIRFAIVGIFATAIHYGVYLFLNLFIFANLAYAIGYLISFLFNYFLSAGFTFKKKASISNGLGFGLSHLVNFILHIVFLNVFLAIGINEQWAPIPVYCICIPVNFLLVRLVFNKL